MPCSIRMEHINRSAFRAVNYMNGEVVLYFFRFLMVFMCLLLSVFSTIEQYEEVAGTIVYYLVRVLHPI